MRPEWLGGAPAFCRPAAGGRDEGSRPTGSLLTSRLPANAIPVIPKGVREARTSRHRWPRSLSFSAARGAIARPRFLRYADSCLLCSPPSISRPAFALPRSAVSYFDHHESPINLLDLPLCTYYQNRGFSWPFSPLPKNSISSTRVSRR